MHLLDQRNGLLPQVQLIVQRCYGAGCNPAGGLTAPGSSSRRCRTAAACSGTSTRNRARGDIVGPTIYGHAGAAAAISSGAIRFSDPRRPEYFSSRGPVTHYFGPVDGVDARRRRWPNRK